MNLINNKGFLLHGQSNLFFSSVCIFSFCLMGCGLGFEIMQS